MTTVFPNGSGKPGPSRRALVLIAAGVIAVIGIAAFALGAVGGGGDDEALDTGPPLSPGPRVTSTPTTPPARAQATGERFEGRDPFEDPNGNGGTPSPGETPPPDDTGGPDERRVTLTDIFLEDGERFATVQVEDEEYTVQEGDVFAENFQVVDITSRCATFLFGDERFTLCIGQEVRK